MNAYFTTTVDTLQPLIGAFSFGKDFGRVGVEGEQKGKEVTFFCILGENLQYLLMTQMDTIKIPYGDSAVIRGRRDARFSTKPMPN